MVGIPVSFWDGLFSGVMLNFGRVVSWFVIFISTIYGTYNLLRAMKYSVYYRSLPAGHTTSQEVNENLEMPRDFLPNLEDHPMTDVSGTLPWLFNQPLV